MTALLHALRTRAGRHPTAATAVLFLLLTVVHTWPLASAPGYWSRNNSGDALLNTWAVAWVGHALGTRPLRLYDANIFHPERRTLAFSEHLVVQGALVAPVVWLGGSAVLAFNLSMMAGFALTGFAFAVVVRRWTGSWAAGCVAGSAAAFNAHTLMRLPHLQTLHLEFFPVALLALDRLFAEPKAKHAVLVGCAHALQGLTSIYILVFTSWALVFAALARAPEWMGRGRRRALALLLAAVAVAVVLLAPFLYAYVLVNREMGFVRSIEDARYYAATWSDYLLTGSRLHWALWSSRFAESRTPNFPGVTATALALVAVGTGLAWRDRRARMALFVTIGCVLLSIGPRLPGYALLHAAVPLLQAVRVMAHFGQIAILGLAMLAGFGVAWLAARWTDRRRWALVTVVLMAAVNGEALRAPFAYTPFEGIPAIYDFLARERRAIVAELPLVPRQIFFANAGYMLNSTRHWHPILNGYSGFVPASYLRAYERLRSFPAPEALAALRGLGVTHVVVHRDEFRHYHGAAAYDAIPDAPGLERYAVSAKIQMYKLRGR